MNEEFKNKKIAILGLGVEGLSSLNFFSKHGGQLSVRDQKEEKDLDSKILEEAKKITSDFIFGPTYLSNLVSFNVIVRSPSVRPDLPEILEAVAQGALLTSNMKIFFDLSQAEIIGVTGTKGKGTTTSLIGEILKKAGKKVFVGGNIGIPPLDFIDQLGISDWVVLEISSFQLMGMEKSPHIAVILMTTSEHLDWHKSGEEYVEAKMNIIKYQSENDFAVINIDYPAYSDFIEKTKAKKTYVSLLKKQKPGVFLKDDDIVRSFGNKTEEILAVKEVFLRGRHNLENVVAAAAAASVIGVSAKEIAEVARSFKGLPHRLEFVKDVGGVKYYNDSFSTTPETAIAAIKSFSEPLILILGGSEKGSDYSSLAEVINEAKNIKGIILIGDTASKIKEEIGGFGKFHGRLVEDLKNMSEIISTARSMASSGDIVLLSPACASFGLFKNYKDRGEQFKNIVNSLPNLEPR